ncbi:MAG: potassium channel family protein [Betaproteobacteria bacterium]|nr:potassium channel family protein [Betaproteobacteria bacterium]
MDTAHPQSGPYLLFMLALSVVALGLLAVDALMTLDAATHDLINLLDNAVCVLFLLDFALTFWRAENRMRYFFTWGWLDLISSIPMIDALRWGRLARVFRIFRVLRALRAARLLGGLILEYRAQSAALTAALISLLLVTFSAIAILHLETAPGSNIRTAEEALWWAVTTITTVGYGDFYPVTTEGRFLATGLMVSGVGLFGAFSGLVASWLMRPEERQQDSELAQIQAELAALRADLARRDASNPPPRDGA